MKERTIDLQRTVVAYYQAPEVSEPADRAFDHPAFSVPAQRSAILRGCTNAVLLVRTDQFDPATPQTSAQRIAVVRSVGNHPFRLLARTPRVMPSAYADRRQRRLREFDLRRGCRTRWSPRGTPVPSTTTIHFVPLPRLVFPTPQPLFSRKQNCRPKTTRSSPVARARSTRSKTCARYSAKRPAPPSRAAAASRSRDADIGPASPASGRRSAESRESLPAPDGSRSTGGHPCGAGAVWGARARSFATALRSATVATVPSALPRRC